MKRDKIKELYQVMEDCICVREVERYVVDNGYRESYFIGKYGGLIFCHSMRESNIYYSLDTALARLKKMKLKELDKLIKQILDIHTMLDVIADGDMEQLRKYKVIT